MLYNLLLAGIGGFFGAASRFAATYLINSSAVGIFAVNCIGSFFAGLILALPSELVSFQTRILCVTGFLGAFTTFSAFSVETLLFLKSGNYGVAALNVAASVAACLAASALGFFIAHRFF